MIRQKTYFVSAGEHSGDLLGKDLVKALALVLPQYKSYGIVGEQMRSVGVKPLADIADLSVMGFVEVIRHLPRLKRLEKKILEDLDSICPDFAILIDYPGFHMHLAKKLKARKIRVYQYVAPQLWAWRPRRAERLRDVTDGVFGIMPFEENFFREWQVNYEYVGTPQVDRVKKGKKFDHDLFAGDAKILGFFPGSRTTEVARIIPEMMRIHHAMQNKIPRPVIFSLAENLDPNFLQTLFQKSGLSGQKESWPLRKIIEISSGIYILRGNSLELMASVDAALVASGTATLECGLLGTPMAVIYKLNSLSWRLAQFLVNIETVSLVNLVAGKKIVEEFLQEIDPDIVAECLCRLMDDQNRRESLVRDLSLLTNLVKGSPHVALAERMAEIFQP